MQPQDYVFGIGENDILDQIMPEKTPHCGLYICPIADPEFDQHLPDEVGEMLPVDATGDHPGQDAECAYSVIGKGIEEYKAELIAVGFVHNPDMDW